MGSHKRRGSWQKWLQKCGLYPTGSLQGPPGHTQGSRGKGHLGPSRRRRQEAESRARGTMGQEKADRVTKCGVSLHTRHHTHFVLKQLRQPAAKQFQPPTPPTRPSQNADNWGPGLLPAPKAPSSVFGLEHPVCPKPALKGSLSTLTNGFLTPHQPHISNALPS